MRRKAVNALGLVFAFAACDGGGSGAGAEGGASGMPSGGGAGTSLEPGCVSKDCTCADGSPGRTQCPAGECACALCTFTADEPPSFTACGGDPAGEWRLVDFDATAFFLTRDGDADRGCPGRLRSATPFDALVEFEADGTGELTMNTRSLSVDFDGACILEQVGSLCEGLSGFDCVLDDCGLCRCSYAWDYSAGTFSWSRLGSQMLTLGSGDRFEYCVDADTLTMRLLPSGELFTYERVLTTGRPTPCGSLSPETCRNGWCNLGICAGMNCATIGTEEDCNAVAGCAWDPTRCHGAVPAECTSDDYLRGVPGCHVLTGDASCAGTPAPCENQPDCAANGCTVGAGCVGGTNPCFAGDQGVPGCTCTGSDCTGNFACSSLSEQLECVSTGPTNSCGWSPAACVGTPVPCEDLPSADCEDTTGCDLVVP